MKHPVDNHLAMRYRKATGLPVLRAKQDLEKFNAEEQLTCIVAAENTAAGIVVDPLEQDETVGPVIRDVMAVISERVRREHERRIDEVRKTHPEMADFLSRGRGICHRVWHETKLALELEHGIYWRSPADLNPNTIFD